MHVMWTRNVICAIKYTFYGRRCSRKNRNEPTYIWHGGHCGGCCSLPINWFLFTISFVHSIRLYKSAAREHIVPHSAATRIASWSYRNGRFSLGSFGAAKNETRKHLILFLCCSESRSRMRERMHATNWCKFTVLLLVKYGASHDQR